MNTTRPINPETLEQLYRKNRTEFQQTFEEFSSQSPEDPLVQFWNIRLQNDKAPAVWFSRPDINFILATLLIFGTIATGPSWLGFTEDSMSGFYLRNIGFIAFVPLLFYFFRLRETPVKLRIIITAVIVSFLGFLNLLPGDHPSPPDTLILAGIHLPIILWGMLGFIYDRKNPFEYLRFNGDLIISAGLLFLAWMLMSVLTMGLFGIIGMNLEEFYPRYIMVYGFSAIPVLATITVIKNNGFVSQVSPWIARIFSPLALIMLTVFLVFFLISGSNPFTNRDYLVLFNAILVAVLALILFALSSAEQQWLRVVLLALSLVTILVNITALSAIVYRLSDMGLTPNRLAVLGSNLIFLVNLIIVAARLRGLVMNRISRQQVMASIGAYLPVYVIWCAVVVILFPLIFSFR
ncbi:MAG: hypothetical protein ACO3FI_12710 [Cyclobacteriaceae bacterium]